jgi:ribosomal-protein-alanine N-acetyltransferase
MTTVRPGAPQDGAALTRIQQATLAEPWPELLETALSGPPPLFVADDGEPVGYAIVVSEGSRAYVPELAVHPDRQSEGHGSALLSALVEEFSDHEEMRLTVRAVDERAQAFYRDHGFEQVDRIADHFESGDGLLFARPLDDV